MNRTFTIFFSLLTINFFIFLSLAEASTQESNELMVDEDSSFTDETDDAATVNAEEAGTYDSTTQTASNSYADDDSTNETASKTSHESEEQDEDLDEDSKDHDPEKNWEEANKFVNEVKGYSDNFPINNVGESTPYAVNSEYISRSPAIVERSGADNSEGGNEENLEIDPEN